MKRLGKFSGKIYNESETKDMRECGVMISDEQAQDEEFIRIHRIEDLLDCLKCFGCPMANGLK